MKVASLAGMPRRIVRHAEEVAAAMETSLASVFGAGGATGTRRRRGRSRRRLGRGR